MNPSQRPPEPTAADYFAVVFGPVLIMLLVGSLTWFLAEVTYGGRYSGMVLWSLGWFVLASVLVSRISIELGAERAVFHGLALGGVTALWIIRYIDPPWIPLALLGVIWWCASKLVWDCTYISDDEDATGEGLLDAAARPEAKDDRRLAVKPSGVQRMAKALFPTLVFGVKAKEMVAARVQLGSRRPGHTPGRWVVYFSLLALPLFGLGQVVLPNEPASRAAGFRLLWFYVAAALGLLLMTSFLGLRRYLRQRGLRMPTGIAASWIGLGIAIALGVLYGAVLLPRPDASYSLPALAQRLGTRLQATDAKKGRTTSKDSAEGRQPADGREPSRDAQTSGGEKGAAKAGDASTAGSGQHSGKRVSPTAPPPPASLGDILRWGVYAVFALIGVAVAIRHARSLVEGLRQFWQALGRFLLGSPAHSGRRLHRAALRQARSFDAYRDPFREGTGQRPSREAVLRYTFEAMQAWGAEWGWPRGEEETPLEYGWRLGQQHPPAATEINATVRGFSELAYANRPPDDACLEQVRQLWVVMTQGRR